MKYVESYEIDCDAGGVAKQTTLSLTSSFAEKLRCIKNPYHGNKRKLLVPIFMTIEKKGWTYNTFLDLFSGSGMVAATARHLGKQVVANDLSPFAFLNAKFFLEEMVPSSSNTDFERILSDTSLDGIGNFVQKFYSDRFTPEEAMMLDRLKANIEHFALNDTTIPYLSVLHHVMDYCFVGGRLNKGQILAELKHRLGHVRNEGKPMPFHNINWLKPFVKGPYGAAVSFDALRFARMMANIDICYIDPPYGGGQSDYLAMYRFFNEYITGSREDSPEASRFVAAKTYKQNFDDLLDAVKIIPKLVLSYNDESWAKVDDIVGAIKRFRKEVAVEKVKYEYNYRDQERTGQEFIILAE